MNIYVQEEKATDKLLITINVCNETNFALIYLQFIQSLYIYMFRAY
jgi:hypothetical protein